VRRTWTEFSGIPLMCAAHEENSQVSVVMCAAHAQDLCKFSPCAPHMTRIHRSEANVRLTCTEFVQISSMCAAHGGLAVALSPRSAARGPSCSQNRANARPGSPAQETNRYNRYSGPQSRPDTGYAAHLVRAHGDS